MQPDDVADPDRHDLTSAREEFAGWDPYVIRLCRTLSPASPESPSTDGCDDLDERAFV